MTEGTTPTSPKAAPAAPAKETGGKRDLWTTVMLGLIEGFLASSEHGTKVTARIYKELLDNAYEKMKKLEADLKQITIRKEKEGKNYASYTGDLEQVTTQKQITQMSIGQLEAGLNGILQTVTTTMNMALKFVNEVAQLGSKVAGGLGG